MTPVFKHTPGIRRQVIAATLAACLILPASLAQTPAPQGSTKPQSPSFVPTSKELCAVTVALGEIAAQSLINLTLAMLNQTSPPEKPKMLPLKLCAYCDICISDECYTLTSPADGNRLIQEKIRESLSQAVQSQKAPQQLTVDLPVFALNTSVSEVGPDGRFISAPNTVDFFDGIANEFETRVDIDAGLPDGFYEPQDMALSEDGDSLVVVSRGADPEFFANGPLPHLTIVDVPSRSLSRRIFLDPIDFPSNLVLSPDGSRAYVSSPLKQEGRFIDGAALVEVDLDANRVSRRLELPFSAGGGAGEIVITPDGSQLVVILDKASGGTGPKLAVVDARTLTVAALYPNERTETFARLRLSQPSVTELAMDPTGSRVYVSDARVLAIPNDRTLGIAVFDMATAEVTEIIAVPGKESGGDDDLQIYGDGMVLVATDARTGTVFGIDALTGEIRYQSKIAETFFSSELIDGP